MLFPYPGLEFAALIGVIVSESAEAAQRKPVLAPV
jgi:hypothetical protein